MKVLKFTEGIEFPEIEYFEETIGLDDNFSPLQIYFVSLAEIFGLNDSHYQIYEEALTEIIGLNDTQTLILSEEILEILGLSELTFQYDWVDAIETLGLSDNIYPEMIYSISLEENIGFVDIGHGLSYVFKKENYDIKWRTRTKRLNYGYGAASYGSGTFFGEGDVIDELKEFKVKVFRLSDDQLLRTATITIVDKKFPDASAQYIYTVAMNESDNGYFEPKLKFEIFQVDINNVWSPGKHIDITPYLLE